MEPAIVKNSLELYIVGPTASGKSALAMRVAQTHDGEIVCADSQTIRRHLDIGTAKPTIQDQSKVTHHMLDIIEPFDNYSVSLYQEAAKQAVENIKARNILPIIVGGSGLYIDSLLFNYSVTTPNQNEEKDSLEKLSVSELQKIIKDKKYPMPLNSNNPRHLIGVILRRGEMHEDRTEIDSHKKIIGILPNDETLKKRIDERVENMFAHGFIDEVKELLERYGSFPDRLDAIGYPIAEKYLSGEITEKEAKERFKRADWQYARRQKAWFKRNKYIEWFSNEDDAYAHIDRMLVTRKQQI